MLKLYDIDYNNYVDIIGTAHFTRRSINDAYKSIKSLKPEDIAIELDQKRFERLNTACLNCSKRGSCLGLCEFTGAAEALGNVNANIWLIDMTIQEINQRIRNRTLLYKMYLPPSYRYLVEDPIWLWEKGYKERVNKNSEKEMATLRKIFPSVWQVLIDERNALMSARIAWIASKNAREEKQSKILALVGAAHVEGIRELLGKPLLMKHRFAELGLPFTVPTLIRRVAIRGD